MTIILRARCNSDTAESERYSETCVCILTRNGNKNLSDGSHDDRRGGNDFVNR
jgi:hypothetical protein